MFIPRSESRTNVSLGCHPGQDCPPGPKSPPSLHRVLSNSSGFGDAQTHNVGMVVPIADFVVSLGSDGQVLNRGTMSDSTPGTLCLLGIVIFIVGELQFLFYDQKQASDPDVLYDRWYRGQHLYESSALRQA